MAIFSIMLTECQRIVVADQSTKPLFMESFVGLLLLRHFFGAQKMRANCWYAVGGGEAYVWWVPAFSVVRRIFIIFLSNEIRLRVSLSVFWGQNFLSGIENKPFSIRNAVFKVWNFHGLFRQPRGRRLNDGVFFGG